MQCLREHRPTLFFAVPTLYQRLLTGGVERDLFAGVRLCISAGEALPPPLLQRWQDCVGQPIYDGIGSTEAMHIFCSNRPGAYRPGSSGRPVAGYELKIVDAAGLPVASGEPGYLWVRGATLAQGYWNQDAATAAAFRGDWLATGDIYGQDADGYFNCLGRADDVFKSSGQWVSPVEIEQALLTCAGAREAAVVGVRDASGFTSARAFVVLSEELAAADRDMVRDQIYSQLRRHLSKYKIPTDIQFLPALPKTATGKVSRAELRGVQAGPRPLQSVTLR
jgi:acyl-coenzyme A synthetase/AMP-(fatty) acid ligase